MLKLKFLPTLKRIGLKKKYIIFSIFYGLSSLIIPFGTQFLVNNLALAGIWVNTISFLVIIATGLLVSQVFRYCQVIITEYMQRELFLIEMGRWQSQGHAKHAYYYFEIIKILKTYSKSFTNLVEMGLVLIFGLLTMIFFHPAFIILAFILYGFFHWVFSTTRPAIQTSIEESNKKYDIYHTIADNKKTEEEELNEYLHARNNHFHYIKRNALLVGILYVISQFYLLGVGLYLIQANQLSVGQLVSAEIILSGILAALMKLPQTLEDLYDFETSEYKLNKALSMGKYDE
jgi:ABC-type bacteriocin/lantibiotic exporter with double-glycine peptidase domain